MIQSVLDSSKYNNTCEKSRWVKNFVLHYKIRRFSLYEVIHLTKPRTKKAFGIIHIIKLFNMHSHFIHRYKLYIHEKMLV